MTEEQVHKKEVKKLKRLWLELMNEMKENFGRKPNLQSMLFLIGVQELGQLHRSFSKEEKQDLMHLAVCKLLEGEGYFEYTQTDEDGWPHYKTLKNMPATLKGLKQQEALLRKRVLIYFNKL